MTGMKELVVVAALLLVACEEKVDPNDTKECREWQAMYVLDYGDEWKALSLQTRPEGCDIP